MLSKSYLSEDFHYKTEISCYKKKNFKILRYNKKSWSYRMQATAGSKLL